MRDPNAYDEWRLAKEVPCVKCARRGVLREGVIRSDEGWLCLLHGGPILTAEQVEKAEKAEKCLTK